jgi:hypothetical protein
MVVCIRKSQSRTRLAGAPALAAYVEEVPRSTPTVVRCEKSTAFSLVTSCSSEFNVSEENDVHIQGAKVRKVRNQQM